MKKPDKFTSLVCLLLAANTALPAVNALPIRGGLVDTETLTQTQAVEMMKNTSTGFIKNVGQIYDVEKKLHPEVLYQFNGSQFSVFLTNKGLTYGIIKFKTDPFNHLNHNEPVADTDDKFDLAALEMTLIGADIRNENIVESEHNIQEGVINFYGSNLTDNALGLRKSKQLTIKNIYPGIDWILKTNDDKGFKYDFIVHPGADISNIKFEYKGQTKAVFSNYKRYLTLSTPLGEISEGPLYCYQDNQEVLSHWKLNDNSYSITIDNYDPSKKIVVDPIIQMARTWATYLGGAANDEIRATKILNGTYQIWVVGITTSYPFPVKSNGTGYYTVNNSTSALKDGFISSFSISGAQLFCTYYFSSDEDAIYDIAASSSGNEIYITGYTFSNVTSTVQFPYKCPGTVGGYCKPTPPAQNSVSAFIAKFNNSGVQLWSTLIIGATPVNSNAGKSISVNSAGDVYVVGTGNCPLKQQGAGFYQTTPGGCFIVGFQSNTIQFWGTYYGGTNQTIPSHIECIANDRIMIVGKTESATGMSPLTPSAFNYYQPNLNGTRDGFFAIFNQNSSPYWISYFGGSGIDEITSCDANSNSIVICGVCVPPVSGFPFQNNGGYFQNSALSFGEQGFITEFKLATSNTGVVYYKLNWSTLFNSTGSSHPSAVSIGQNGYIALAGHTNDVGSFPLVNPGAPFYFDNMIGTSSNADAFIALFDLERFVLWCTLYGANNALENEGASDLEILDKYIVFVGNVYLGGTSATQVSLADEGGSYQQNLNLNLGSTEGFIAKFKNQQNNNLKQATIFNANINSFSIYPNPNSKQFLTVSTKNNPDENSIVQIQITDITGKQILQRQIDFINGKCEMQLPEMQKGIYFISLSDSNYKEVKKLIIN